MIAKLTVEGEIAFAPHLDRWQREIRWLQPVIYFPDALNSVIVGNNPGCDVRAALTEPLIVTFNGSRRLWSWSFPSAPWRTGGFRQSSFELDCLSGSTGSTIKLLGELIENPISFDKQEEI